MSFSKRCSFFKNKEPLESTLVYPYGGADLSGMNALVIAPHPDDESIGCGGSIIRHLRAGSHVRIIFLSDGQKGDFDGRFGEGYIEVRRTSSLNALAVLGVTDYEFWGYPDGELWRFRYEIFNKLKTDLKKLKAGVVYLPSPYEPHPDHRVGAWAGWRLWKKKKQRVAFYEVLAPLYPNIIIDITSSAAAKRKAVSCYETENSYNDYATKTEGLNRCRTFTLSPESAFAEAFMLVDADHVKKYKLPVDLLKTALKAII